MFVYCYDFVVIGIEPWTSHRLDKLFTSEPHLQFILYIFIKLPRLLLNSFYIVQADLELVNLMPVSMVASIGLCIQRCACLMMQF